MEEKKNISAAPCRISIHFQTDNSFTSKVGTSPKIKIVPRTALTWGREKSTNAKSLPSTALPTHLNFACAGKKMEKLQSEHHLQRAQTNQSIQ